MEEILSKLLISDNATILQGTNELREAFKNPDVVPALCNVIGTSQNPQIRQYAAMLLRRKLGKYGQWSRLSADARQSIKQGLVQALVSEQEKFVKTSIGQVIGTLVKHELPNQTWPELTQFIQHMTSSEDDNNRELGFFTLHILTDIAPDQFLAHAHSFGMLFATTLKSLNDLSSPIGYLVLITMTNFVPAVEGDQNMVNLYYELIPRIVDIIKALAKKRPDRALETFTLLDELAGNAITVLVPHIKLILSMCLEFARDKTCNVDIQLRALNLVGDIIRSKKKAIVKQKLVEPVLEVLFYLMSSKPNNDDSEEYFAEDDDNTTPSTCANQILDIMALHLPPEKLLPPLLMYIGPGLQGNDVYVKKASYLAIAVLSEGCADYIRTKHLEQFLRYICIGIQDPAPVVSNAALFALGQFSEYLQPDISQYASELLPLLLDQLGRLAGSTGEPPGRVDRMFYALEMFCENLGDALLPFLPRLMQNLLPLLVPPHAVRLRELAISAMGACGNAAKEGMMPYFQQILECLRMYLTTQQPDDTMCLQVQAIDTLGVLARTIGDDNFRPMARESIDLGIQLMKANDDPDLRKATYGLFASIASVLKEDMASILPTIVEPMVNSVKSGGGIVFHYKDEENSAFPVFDDLSDPEAEEDIGPESDVSSEGDDDDVEGYTVENAYLEEKEEAVLALKELAQYSGVSFLPYLEQCYVEVFKLMNYPQEDVRKAAIDCLLQFCINFSKIETVEGKQALLKALSVYIPKCAEMIRTDAERDVVMQALDAVCDLLKQVGSPVIEDTGHCDAIINCVKDIMARRTECQDEGEEDESEAEQDELLIESAGEIVPALGKAMNPQEFAQHYTQLLPMFVKLTKKECTESQRSFGVGMIAECMAGVGLCLDMFVQQLLPLLITLSRDESDEVRNNSIYAIGELAYHGKNAIFPYYPEILQALSTAVSRESNSGALDNICGALARLIITNVSAIPLDQVLPVFIQYLPLREDFEENKWVFQCLSNLYQLGTEVLVGNLIPVIKACAISLHQNQIATDGKDIVVNLLKMCHRDFPSECAKAATELPQPIAETLQQICVS